MGAYTRVLDTKDKIESEGFELFFSNEWDKNILKLKKNNESEVLASE